MMRRLVHLQNRMLDAMRHREAFDVARREGTAPRLDALRGARQCLIVSFRRSGDPVPTPVNFGLAEDGRLYFRSEPDSAKVRRIRRDPHVRVCACNMRGKPIGPLVEARARVLSEAEAQHADSVVASNWSPAMRALERGLDRMGIQFAYVEVEAAPGAQAQDAVRAASSADE